MVKNWPPVSKSAKCNTLWGFFFMFVWVFFPHVVFLSCWITVVHCYFSSFSCFFGFTSSFYCCSCLFPLITFPVAFPVGWSPHSTHWLSGSRVSLVPGENNLVPNSPNPRTSEERSQRLSIPEVFLYWFYIRMKCGGGGKDLIVLASYPGLFWSLTTPTSIKSNNEINFGYLA